MADEFKIVASLDIPKSASKINADIPALEKKLTSLQILAELDITRSLNSIQSQLNTLANQAKAPTIKVGIDTSGLKSAINNAKSQVSNKGQNNKMQIFDSKQLESEGRKYFTKSTNIIDQVKKYYTRNGALSVDISSIEKSNGQIRSFTASVEEATGVIKKFNFERGKINTGSTKPNYGFVQTDSLKSIDKNAGTNLKSTLNFLSKIDEKIMSIQSKATRQSNPLKEGTTYYDNYNQKLTETVIKIDEIRNANKTLSTEQKNEINKLITELQLYTKEQQKLAYPPMISGTSIEDSVKKAQATLTTLEQKWKTQGILTGEFKTQVTNLRTELEKVGNTEGLNKYNTSLKLVKESARQLETELKNNNGAEQLAQKVAVLIQRIKAYQATNSKANRIYGSDFQRMISELSNPNVDLNTYRRVEKELQSLEGTIVQTGKAGKTMFQKLKDDAGKFFNWMSMTYIISLFAREVRGAVSELKEMDTILTEISKTSDRTETSLAKLGETSFDTASKYGQKATDYLTGVQEMSRAGFGEKESEQMAELSTLAQSAGDMTAELANEYLIATNAGYKLGGSVEKLNSVLD